jgi:hypothetical protein
VLVSGSVALLLLGTSVVSLAYLKVVPSTFAATLSA